MEISAPDFTRLANNFYNEKNIPTDIERISTDSHLFNYIMGNIEKLKKYKVAFCWICLNPLYWQYAGDMINGAKQFFLPGHQVDYFLWSDMPDMESKEGKEFLKQVPENERENYKTYITQVRATATVFPTDGVEWPLPTLMRYHLFLQQEELLKDYDYIFYCDVDMKFVNVVGDEILGEGLTAAPHPGYAVRKEYWPPYEPNEKSEAYIKRPGLLIPEGDKKRFMPMYFAGGFQGGTSKEWFKAMREMKIMIDKDMSKGYTAIWNDETYWNKYLADTPKNLRMLTPSYIYPDSLINEYYIPLWGVNYVPKLVTLTKAFSVSKEGGEAVKRMIQK